MVEREVVNTEQAEAWNTDEGVHWAAHAERYDAMIAAFTQPLLDAATIGDSDSVLDIGCGNGQTSRLAARRAIRGRVVGLDLSGPMLARARDLAVAEGLTNVAFEQGDAQVRALVPASFDVAISRFGVMFFADPVAAFRNVGRGLRPRGRLVFCGSTTGEDATFNLPHAYHFGMQLLGADPYSYAEFGEMLAFVLAAGFDPVIDRVYPLAEVAEAQRRLEAGDVLGKLILVP